MSGYVIQEDGFAHIDKAADGAALPYTQDWTAWLAKTAEQLGLSSVTIASAVVTVDAGLTKIGNAIIAGGLVTQVLAGTTPGSFKALYQITTNVSGVGDARTIVIDVGER